MTLFLLFARCGSILILVRTLIIRFLILIVCILIVRLFILILVLLLMGGEFIYTSESVSFLFHGGYNTGKCLSVRR